ncbi:MAG: BON domain-containing protein [Limnohabitans sp.]|nr:BON domain-containing protein [Limnohabitans sp.]
MKSRSVFLGLSVVLASSLMSACAPLMFGSMMGTVMVATDRRTSGAIVEDEGIELRGNSRMRAQFGERANISVNSYNRQVLLTGEVATEKDRAAAVQIAERIENVKSVLNELAIQPSSSLHERSKDALIKGKVIASLVDSKDLFANSFKVIVERSNVYLMGRVTQREATSVTGMTRTIGGVARVVRVFEIISEEELRSMLPSQPKPDASQDAKDKK